VRRRAFITLLSGAAVVWPLAARAQQPERMRRIGVLMNLAADDPEASARVGAFAQGLAELGWTIGANVRIEYRWGAGNADAERKYAAELLALTPDVIVASGSLAVAAFQRLSRTVPIVFTLIADRSARGSSIAWLDQAATRPASCCSNTTSAANGWRCLKRLHQA
jgi:putative tryptophan/tyrosine transport system substrate-binding protein